jgi:hypothetical protein
MAIDVYTFLVEARFNVSSSSQLSNEMVHLPPKHAMSVGIVTVRVILPLPESFSATVRFVWPEVPSALLLKSILHM